LQKTYTTKQVAEILQVTIGTIKRYIKDGEIKGAVKVGKSWRISAESLREVLPNGALYFSEIKSLVSVSDNEEHFNELYPKEYEEYKNGIGSIDPVDVYLGECQLTLDRRFPYPYARDDELWDIDHTNYIKASEPEAYYNFYFEKQKEEIAKLNKLMEALNIKYNVPEEDIGEIKRTFENIQLLKIGQIRWDI